MTANATSRPGTRPVDVLAEVAVERAYRMALGLVGNPADAEEAVHDAIARACELGSRLRDPEASEGWFFRVVTNQCLRVLRRRRLRMRLGLVFGVAAESPPPVPGPAWAIERRVEWGRLHAALDRLPARQRAAVLLRYGQDRPVGEVAELLGVSTATAKTHLVRGLRRLRELLEEIDD